MMLMSSAILFSSCSKKEEEKEDPKFVVAAIPNGDLLTFTAYCSTDDVYLTKVVITDPLLYQYTYTGGGDIWLKNELMFFNDYVKQIGTWKFTFYGSVVEDDRSFTVTSSLAITGK